MDKKRVARANAKDIDFLAGERKAVVLILQQDNGFFFDFLGQFIALFAGMDFFRVIIIDAIAIEELGEVFVEIEGDDVKQSQRKREKTDEGKMKFAGEKETLLSHGYIVSQTGDIFNFNPFLWRIIKVFRLLCLWGGLYSFS